MSKLQELDDLLTEFKKEVDLTQSVNLLSAQLQESAQKQAARLDEAKTQLSASTRQLADTSQQIDKANQKSVQLMNDRLTALIDLQADGFKKLDRLVADQISELRTQQTKHFIEVSNSLQVRLENHRSEIRQIVERESEKLNRAFSGQLAELEIVIQQQGKTLSGLWYLVIAQTVFLIAAIAGQLLQWW